jgi:hypothetical protein
MIDEQFQKLCNTFGFAPSRALREMLDAVTKQERDACAELIDEMDVQHPKYIAAAIRARSNT